MKLDPYFINFIKIKIYFLKPKKNEILLYDRYSKSYAELIFKNKKFTIYDTRYESLNLYVLFLTFFKNGFLNLKLNYKVNFFKIVQPKIIYTSIDNNIGFFKLKKIFPNAIYIADQNGLRDNFFYNKCKQYLRKYPNEKLYTDIFFCFGTNEKDRLLKIITGKILTLGDTKNNDIKIKKSSSKIKKIIFISSGHNTKTFLQRDIKIFKHLKIFSEKNDYKLFFLDKNDRRRYKFLKEKFGFDYNYLNSGDSKTKSNFIKKDTLFVFIISTFGYEILSMGIKVVSLNHTQFNHGFKRYSKKGPFWINAPSFNYNYSFISKIIKSVINYDEKRWKKIYKYYSKQILVYDAQNNQKRKFIKNYLNSR
tara:strand:- start:20041 stop:21132 length:1092 start_codon:yes stop_codon:yes gene_type:complete